MNPTKLCKNGEFWSAGAYAYNPKDGKPNGGSSAGSRIWLEQAQVSVVYCAEQMKGECSERFVGIAPNNGHCYCVKTGDDCAETLLGGYTFELKGMWSFSGMQARVNANPQTKGIHSYVGIPSLYGVRARD